ncbi:hypothetical protein CDAR_275041 [Caerostris darwini]|uniref:Uncharacterized protein n=1 Tax=Caerostris darwini TaxID=1538125 RepID=A0AAV4PJT3_9ARAC|nr:hypothetical protein CDAR_275041 [Caerostris darwini]
MARKQLPPRTSCVHRIIKTMEDNVSRSVSIIPDQGLRPLEGRGDQINDPFYVVSLLGVGGKGGPMFYARDYSIPIRRSGRHSELLMASLET